MNPKITITVDSTKAKAVLEGMVTVGAKVDVVVKGLSASDIPDWGEDDDFTGSSLRFRVVDEAGRDLVRFPLDDGDAWSVSDDIFTATDVDFNTDALRHEFDGIPFNAKMEFGVILDSTVDSAQYATGRTSVRQWSAASTEDPTVLPDWREVLSKLNADLYAVDEARTAAEAAAASASASSSSASASASSASSDALSATKSMNAAALSESNASSSAEEALESKKIAVAAKQNAEASATYAEAAVQHYPRISTTTGNWERYVDGEWVDTGTSATGGHDILEGKTFAMPTSDRERNQLLAYLIREMGGNIAESGITPGTAPESITMTADDGTARVLKIVTNSLGEYTTEVS